jgi:hypothetical protein
MDRQNWLPLLCLLSSFLISVCRPPPVSPICIFFFCGIVYNDQFSLWSYDPISLFVVLVQSPSPPPSHHVSLVSLVFISFFTQSLYGFPPLPPQGMHAPMPGASEAHLPDPPPPFPPSPPRPPVPYLSHTCSSSVCSRKLYLQ